MKIKFLKTLLLIAIFLMAPSLAGAAPTITSIGQPIISDGQSINISGTSFGTKISGNGAPIRFENFKSTDVGKDIGQASGGWWDSSVIPSEKSGIVSTDEVRKTGTASLEMGVYPNSGNSTTLLPTSETSVSRTFVKNSIGFAQTHKTYLNFWVYTDFSNNTLNENIDTQLKFLHLSQYKMPNPAFGYSTYELPQRAYSLWEIANPGSDYIGSSSYFQGSTNQGTISPISWYNSENNTSSIFKAEGWYNMQVEIDQGTADTANASEKVSIVGPNYSKYGVVSQSGKSLIISSPQWYSGITNVISVWYNGKKYHHFSTAAACTKVVPSDPQSLCLTPNLDTAVWREVPSNDYIDSLNFWLWSQKRANNDWNFNYPTLMGSGSSLYSGTPYEIVTVGGTDFTTMGAANNNPGTIFMNTTYKVLGAGDSVRRLGNYKVGAKVDYVDPQTLTEGQSVTPGYVYQKISTGSFNVSAKGYTNNGGNRFMATTAAPLLAGEVVSRVRAYQSTSNTYSILPPDQDPAHWMKMSENPWPSSITKVFLDSLYIDNSFARVEIGDNAVYANSSHREIQPTTSWTDSGAVINVNQGTFPNGSSKYLFVVDESGNASAGYPISFAAQSDSAAPSAPSGLMVQ